MYANRETFLDAKQSYTITESQKEREGYMQSREGKTKQSQEREETVRTTKHRDNGHFIDLSGVRLIK